MEFLDPCLAEGLVMGILPGFPCMSSNARLLSRSAALIAPAAMSSYFFPALGFENGTIPTPATRTS